MIVPMYKYAFLVHHSAYKTFLKEIRDVGVVHILVRNNEPAPEMQELFRHLSEVGRTVSKLALTEESPHNEEPLFDSGEEVFEQVKILEKELEQNREQQVQAEKELSQLQPWGNFSSRDIKILQKEGIEFHFMICPISKFNPDWEDSFHLVKISESEGYLHFIIINRDGEESIDTIIETLSTANEIQLPAYSLTEINEKLNSLKEEEESLNAKLKEIASSCGSILKEYYNSVQMQFDEQNALLQTADEVEGKIKILEGWVPELKKAELDSYLEKNSVLYTCNKPTPDEEVPILLKNNRFAKLYEVIGDLYDLPNHRELDLVPFFAPFYMMFFGFSLGDAGYGLFIILAAQLMKWKKPSMRPVLSLAQWLGLSTVIFGMLTGTFFGIDLMEVNVPVLEKMKAYMIDTNQLFDLAIIVGVAQILFGMILKVVNITRMYGFGHALSTVGWLILIFGLGSIYGLKTAEAITPEAAHIAQIVVLSVSAVFILVLNHLKRNIFLNIGVGLWDSYNMLTGLLGDVLSYLRLFALGISSGILGLVFNSMAMSMKPDHIIFGPLVMLLILIFGHSITIFMSALGAFVHPIRLTFVEFYKNAGFIGGGKAYSPFAKPTSENNE